MFVSTLEHLSYLPSLFELSLYAMVLFNTCNFQTRRQEVEIGLGNNSRVYCLVIFAGSVLFRLENLGLISVKNSNFFIENSLKFFGKVAAIWHLNANLGKVSHIVVNLTIEVMLFCNLKN